MPLTIFEAFQTQYERSTATYAKLYCMEIAHMVLQLGAGALSCLQGL